MPVQEAVSTTVRLHMALRRETQGDVARALGVTPQAVSGKLAGRTRWTVDELDKLAEHYGITVPQLVDPPLAAFASSGLVSSGVSVNGRCHTEERRRLGGSVVPFPRRRLATFEVAA